MTAEDVLGRLDSLGQKKNIEILKRFNIPATKAFGVTAPQIRMLAKEIRKNHLLALELWETGYHEARLLAAMIADIDSTSLKLMDKWVGEIENWAQCDCCCAELFQKTRYAESLPFRWSKSRKEYVRRAGFVMIAAMAVHHKMAKDEYFEKYFPIIVQYSSDNRVFVKKAVNWSLRQIGKRNLRLHEKAIALSYEIQKSSSISAKWIAGDAIRELTESKTIDFIKRRKIYTRL